METQRFVILLVLSSGIAYCQSGKAQTTNPSLGLTGPSAGPVTPEEYRLQTVKWLLTLPSPLKNGMVQLHRMGDEASADLLRILASRPPLTDAEERTALDIIRISFEHPHSILKPENRQPNAVLTLLQQLDAGTQNFTLKLLIADTKQAIFNALSTAK
jgi:hypothetical protein